MDEVTVYDQGGKLLAVLDNADAVSYELKHNDLWTAAFPCRRANPKNVYCQAHNLVRLPDGSRDTAFTASSECPARRKRQRAECESTAWSM